MSSQQLQTSIITVPKHLAPSSLDGILTKYKTLRLAGLQTNPNSFTSTYSREIQYTDETWAARLLNPLARIFIAVQPATVIDSGNDSDSDLERLSGRNWVGQLTLLGPVIFPVGNEKADNAPWELFKDINFEQAAKAEIAPGSRVVYILVGMYVLPEAQGRGVGRGLVEAAVRAVDAETNDNGVAATIVVLVLKDNARARSLYEQVGFVAGAKTVYIEGDEGWSLFLNVGRDDTST
ncbi:hypothetical protein BDV12DRAFT_206346 [Aspergillus spectabilis]